MLPLGHSAHFSRHSQYHFSNVNYWVHSVFDGDIVAFGLDVCTTLPAIASVGARISRLWCPAGSTVRTRRDECHEEHQRAIREPSSVCQAGGTAPSRWPWLAARAMAEAPAPPRAQAPTTGLQTPPPSSRASSRFTTRTPRMTSTSSTPPRRRARSWASARTRTCSRPTSPRGRSATTPLQSLQTPAATSSSPTHSATRTT